MYLLDTDHLSILQRREAQIYHRLQARLDAVGDENIFVSIVSFHEHVAGWNHYLARARTPKAIVYAYGMLRSLLDDFSEMQVCDFDDEAAEQVAQWKTQRIRVGTLDLRIAAIAVTNHLTLLTRNHTDFEKVPGLIVEDWLN